MRLTSCLRDFKKVGEMTKKYANLPDSYIKRSMDKVSTKWFLLAGKLHMSYQW